MPRPSSPLPPPAAARHGSETPRHGSETPATRLRLRWPGLSSGPATDDLYSAQVLTLRQAHVLRLCSAHVLEIADEDQTLTGLDHPAGSLVAVGQMRRNLQSAPSSDLHPLDALIPAGDDHSGSEAELQRRAAIV